MMPTTSLTPNPLFVVSYSLQLDVPCESTPTLECLLSHYLPYLPVSPFTVSRSVDFVSASASRNPSGLTTEGEVHNEGKGVAWHAQDRGPSPMTSPPLADDDSVAGSLLQRLWPLLLWLQVAHPLLSDNRGSVGYGVESVAEWREHRSKNCHGLQDI